MSQNAPEILLIDKTKGITSYDVIRALKRRLGRVKIGHAGTLDPNATGLMVIGIGTGTKLLSDYLKLPKTYEAEVLFGIRTDSGDITGKILEEKDASLLTEGMLASAVKKIEGRNSFPVPKFSAIKQGGKALYTLARAGEEFTPPEKVMEVRSAEIRSFKIHDGKARAEITFDVGSGTYIRTLAEEIGKLVHLPATLTELRRTRIGDFTLAGTEKI
jgi:tRNA pseudouridine55 synthase